MSPVRKYATGTVLMDPGSSPGFENQKGSQRLFSEKRM